MSSSQLPQFCGPLDFVECAACRAKPGMPILCESCLHNRRAISTLRSNAESLAGISNNWMAEARFWKWWFFVGTTIVAVVLWVLGYFTGAL